MDAARSAAPDHPKLEVRKTQGVPKVKNFTVLSGFGVQAQFVAFNNSLMNLEKAVKERVFYTKAETGFAPPPKPISDTSFGLTLSAFEGKLKHYLPWTAPVPLSGFPSMYSGRLRQVYQQAVDSLQHTPLRNRDAYVRVFIKWEKLLVKKGKTPADLVPRVISPRSPRFNAELGVFLKPLEKRLIKAISRVFGSPTVMKGMNAEEVGKVVKGKWDKFDKPVAVGADASRFDQHVSQSALKWEHRQYLKCFAGKDKRRLAWLLGLQLENHVDGYTPEGSIHYTTDGGRMSGDMNTGLGNCLLMCAMMYSWAAHKGISKFELLNNGDDCVMLVEQAEYDTLITGFSEYFHGLGFNMVVEEPVYIIEQISFCQTQPVFDGTKYIMMRDPRIALSKDSISMLQLTDARYVRTWSDAIGQAGLHLTGGLPVMQNAYRSYVKYGIGKKVRGNTEIGSGFQQMVHGLTRKFRPVEPVARYSFWLAFGIYPEYQLQLEKWYDDIPFDVQGGDGSIIHNPQLSFTD